MEAIILFYWYLGFYLNVCSIARQQSALGLFQVGPAFLLPYFAFFKLNWPEDDIILWDITSSKGGES